LEKPGQRSIGGFAGGSRPLGEYDALSYLAAGSPAAADGDRWTGLSPLPSKNASPYIALEVTVEEADFLNWRRNWVLERVSCTKLWLERFIPSPLLARAEHRSTS